MTQPDRLLTYLRMHRYIFPLAAAMKLGIYRVADPVHKLRCKGYRIRTDMTAVTNRYGEVTLVAKYVYLGEPK
jgi:hypothetical protein